MNDKELEDLLRESAETAPMKDFSERWEQVKDRIPPSEKRIRFSYKTFLALASSVCLIVLAVVLPLFLRNAEEKHYFSGYDLAFKSVTEDRFSNELNAVGLLPDNLQQFELDKYFIAFTKDDAVVGGMVSFENLTGEEEYIFTVTFLSSLSLINEADYKYLTKEMTVGAVTVRYQTVEEELYESKALAQYKGLTYIIEYSSLNDDLNSFLSQLFSA